MTFFHFENEGFLDEDYQIVSNSDELQMAEEKVPEEIGILTLKNTVLFPGVVIPITVGRDKSIRLVKDAYRSNDRKIGVVAQRNVEIEDPRKEDVYTSGTLAQIHKMIKMPDGSITIVIQGRSKFQITEFTQEDPYFKAKIRKVTDDYPEPDQVRALMYSLKEEASRIIDLSPQYSE